MNLRHSRVVLTQQQPEVHAELTRQFHNTGMDVFSVMRKGQDLLSAIHNHKPHAVVLDVRLQDMDVFQVLEQYQFISDETEPPLFYVLGADISPYLVPPLLKKGVRHVFPSPCRLSAVVERVRTDLEREQLRDVPPADHEQELLREVSEVVRSLAIPANLKGYHFLRQSIVYAVTQPDSIHRATKQLYPAVGEHFGVTAQQVERCIRNAIQAGWAQADPDVLQRYFGYYAQTSKCPTNRQFIAAVADCIRLRLC